MIENARVSIVYDPSKKKPRARYEKGGWVRFPNNLRSYGNVYLVDKLEPGMKGSWIAMGEIKLLHKEN